MKNHWIEQRRIKTSNDISTISFQAHGFVFFSPRIVTIVNSPPIHGSYLGDITVNFENAMFNTSDIQLSNLFARARSSMNGWSAVVSLYRSMNMLQYSKIDNLKFKSLQIGAKVTDMEFCFEYGNYTTFYCA
jgi:hypothetical protein